MYISAKIKRNSVIYKSWMTRNAIGGSVSHVRFVRKGREFVADDLLPEDAAKLEGHRQIDIDIEIMAAHPDDLVPEAPDVVDDEPAMRPIDDDAPVVKRAPGRPRKT